MTLNMTPEQLRQFEDMKRRIEELERMTNLDTVQNIKERLIRKRSDVDTTGIDGTENSSNTILRDVTVNTSGASDTITILDAPDNFIELDYNGKIYKLAAWQ